LIRACAPVHLSHKALPEARDKFGLRERTLFNNGVHSSDDLFPCIFSNPRGRKEKKKKGEYEFGRTSEGWSSRSRASLMVLVISSLMRAFCLRVHQSATCGRPAPRKCASSTESERLFGGKKMSRSLIPPFLSAPAR